MKKSEFWFGFILTVAILFVIMCFKQADNFRTTSSMGSEVFMIALPLWMVWKKFKAMGQKIEKLKEYNKALQKAML